jgi:hypothetical protein
VNTQPYGLTQILVKTGEISATDAFTILPQIIKVIPKEAQVGSKVRLVGSGYRKNETIEIDFGRTTKITQGMTTDRGTFSFVFIVDTQPQAEYIITAKMTNATSIFDTDRLGIIPLIYKVSPTYGHVGEEVLISGSGYKESGTVSITFGESVGITTTYASKDGTFTAAFIIDTQPYGTTTIKAYGSKEATDSYKILPQIIKVIPTEGIVSKKITVIGSGYKPSTTLLIDFGKTFGITQSITSEKGTFTAIFIINTQPYGTTTISAYQQHIVDTDVCKILSCIISVSPTKGFVGDKVTLKGCGYITEDTVIIAFGATDEITKVKASYLGTFTAVFTVNTQPHYKTLITATSWQDKESTDTDAYTINGQIIKVSPTLQYVGEEVELKGTGFIDTGQVNIGFGITNL